jgi:hypothetical protein
MRSIRGFGGFRAHARTAMRRPHGIQGFGDTLANGLIGAVPMLALVLACTAAPQGARADEAPAAPVIVPAPVLPPPAAGPDAHATAMMRAGRLKQLDIMLMVTALRCRAGADDFQADYHAFEAAHMDAINDASRLILAEATARLGADAGHVEMERVVTATANRYGNGHPWLGCGDLHHLAHDLAEEHSDDALIAEAAEVLDGDDGAKGVALAMLGR